MEVGGRLSGTYSIGECLIPFCSFDLTTCGKNL